jgi:hypothetical protein
MGIVILQNCLDLLKAEPGSYSETCVTSYDGNQVVGMNTEEVKKVQEDEDPLLMSQVIKVENEVSRVCICVGMYSYAYPELTILFLISVSAHMKYLHSSE